MREEEEEKEEKDYNRSRRTSFKAHIFPDGLSFVTIASFANARYSSLRLAEKAAACQPFQVENSESGCLRIRDYNRSRRHEQQCSSCSNLLYAFESEFLGHNYFLLPQQVFQTALSFVTIASFANPRYSSPRLAEKANIENTSFR
ncbi:Gag protease polyprotein [Hibiscus syriacus]|uniref:Gag protease polyprotein n=1 Tax=Hibiscus syriacus TaxID=106335 RepID=A0A6A3BLE9_HIBSY|nr:Gag protease polyprotein [Hibiscus syriacus]